MKKIICIFVSAMLMAGMLISSVSAVADEIAYPQEGWSPYRPYEVVIILREEYSQLYKIYDASDFPEIPVVKCDSGYIFPEEYVKDPDNHYQHMCRLVYDSASGLSMEEAMTMIAQNLMVEKVFPNFIIELDDIIVTPSPVIGDVNGDGSLDAKDVMVVMESMAKKEENQDFDFNNDGAVNAKDVMRLMWLILVA